MDLSNYSNYTAMNKLTTKSPLTTQLYRSNYANESYFHSSVALFLSEVSDLLKKCYGPYGSHILIGSNYGAEATKDGKYILSKMRTNATISSDIHNSIINVANKQVEEVGDGSTTTILLLCELYNHFRNIMLQNNLSPAEMSMRVKRIVDDIISLIPKHATKIIDEDGKIDYDLLYSSIFTSVDANKDLANKLIEMYKTLDCTDPYILVDRSPTDVHSFQLIKGLEVEAAALRPEVFFSGFSRKEYNNPYIIVVNGRLDLTTELFVNLADHCIRNDMDVIFLATGMDDILLENVINIASTNPTQFNRLAVMQIMRTATDDRFLDMCASLGAIYLDDMQLKRCLNINSLLSIINKASGHCEKAQLTEFCARFSSPKSNEEMVKERLDIINENIEALKKDPTAVNDRIPDLELRKASLSKNYAKFYAGGTSPQRKNINFELAADAILQTASCMKHGIVSGGNFLVPDIIYGIEYDDNIDSIIADYIYEAYVQLYSYIIENKINDPKESKEMASVTVLQFAECSNGVNANIRDNCDVPVYNSADTDRAILQNATDMAVLLATTKGYLSTNCEYDVVNKNYN